jgi:hypothetical protein
MSMHKLISGAVLGAALAVAGHDATAQPSLPQPRISAPPAASRNIEAAGRNIEAALARMTERYSLSTDQAARVRTILEEQARKFEQVANQGLPPQDGLGRLKALQDEEVSRVSAVLTPEQRRMYEQEARSALPAGMPSGSR